MRARPAAIGNKSLRLRPSVFAMSWGRRPRGELRPNSLRLRARVLSESPAAQPSARGALQT